MTDTACTRRQLLKKGLKGAVVGAITLGLGNFAINSIDALVNTADAETHDSASSYAESAVHVPTMDEINTLMARHSVDDILQEEYDLGAIEQIETKGFMGKKTTFKEKVYESDKPSLVMFYNSKEKKDKHKGYQNREAIIFKSLANSFSNDMNFLAYDISIQKDYTKDTSGNSYLGTEVQKNESVTGTPSMAIYSKFDLVEGETAVKNNGEIKQIDIFRGGPNKDEFIPQWFKTDGSINNWVIYNAINPNDNYTYRAKNSGTPFIIHY